MSLSSLGISAYDERIYRMILRDPGLDAASAAQALGLDQVEVDAAVHRLAALGLLLTNPSETLTAIDPGVAIDHLVRARVAEVEAEFRRITVAQATLLALLAERVTGQAVEHVERLEGRDQVQRRIWQTVSGSQECLTLRPQHHRVRQSDREANLRHLHRGMVFRTVVHRRALADPEVAAYLRDLHDVGDHHRVTDEPIQMMIILDRATAFVQITPDVTETGAILIRQPGVVATLVDLFEQAWTRGTDLDQALPTPQELQVLDLLLRGGKDEAAARTMGVSVRTFRGHVAALMARLGAANRFQAGVCAKERGWI